MHTTRFIAGHEFRDTPNGVRCVKVYHDGRVCHMAWMHVRTARTQDIGNIIGFAHVNYLTCGEQAEIAAEVEAESQHLWLTVIDAASSGSR